VRLRTTADEGWLELLPSDEEGLDHAIGRLFSIVFAAQQDGTWSRLKVCAECHWALYDHTKSYLAAWCGSPSAARGCVPGATDDGAVARARSDHGA
jgi:hypothetical protein